MAGFVPKDYRQGDPRWASMKLLPSPLTMRTQGCVTVLAARIASNVTQRDFTPGQLCRDAQLRKGYTTGGLYFWSHLEAFVRRYGKVVKYLGRENISAELKKRAKYILRVVYIGQYRHFVGVKSTTTCFDPLDGTVKVYPASWRRTSEYRYFA